MKRENGQSMVEFALVVPFLLLLVFGIIDFGWLFYNQLSVQNACREGARFACVSYSADLSSVATQVESKVQENIDESGVENLTVTTTWLPDEASHENVEVKVEGDIPILTPVLGTFYPGNQKHVTYSVVMKVET